MSLMNRQHPATMPAMRMAMRLRASVCSVS